MLPTRKHARIALPFFQPLALASLAAVAQAAGNETRSLPESQSAVALTIYNENLALIKDTRPVHFEAGRNTIAWRGVAASMRPETALLRDLNERLNQKGSLRLIEQNFDFDLLTPAKLLEKYVGKTVRVIKTHPTSGVESSETATVLASNNGVVLRFADRIETQPGGRIVFPDVPATLRDKPTLSIQMESADSGKRPVELSYLASGLGWRADYVAELATDEKSLAINGWVTLTNQSGAAYHNAQLQLVAGDVNLVTTPRARRESRAPEAAPIAALDRAMQEESLLDYHLYTLAHRTTLRENQTKQVALLSAQQIPARKEYHLNGNTSDYRDMADARYPGQQGKVAVMLSFANREPGLGIPLPKGIVRVYTRDSNGSKQFVGEDRIVHTPKNENVRLKLGEAFDITAWRKQTDFQRVDAAKGRDAIYEFAYEITLKNAQKQAVTVKVTEPVPGSWQILEESHPHQKEAANAAVWNPTIPAEGTSLLKYRVRVRY